MANHCPLLREISLQRCSAFGLVGLRELCNRCSQTLKIIDISHCPQITNDALTILGACNDIEELHLKGCFNITDDGVRSMVYSNQYLRHIDVSDCRHFGESGDIALKEIGKSCVRLKSVDATKGHSVRDEGLIAIAKGCKYIEVLKLPKCTKVTGDSIRWFKNCKELRVLWLPGCVNLMKDDIKIIAFNCKLLESANFSGSRVDADGIASLTEHCLRLQHLDLSSCSNIGDKVS